MRSSFWGQVIYASLLICGWSPRRVADYAKEKCEERISHDTFLRLKQAIQKTGNLQDGIKKRLWASGELEVMVDEFQEMMALTLVQKNLLVEMLNHKDAITQTYGGAGNLMLPMLIEKVSEQNKIVFNMMEKILEWKNKLGRVFIPQDPPKRSIREELDELTMEEKKALFAVLDPIHTNILARQKEGKSPPPPTAIKWR